MTDLRGRLAYAVAVSRPAGPLAVRADAVDNAGNRASVTRVVQVTADADTTAPTVSVFAPATAFGGATVQVEAVVTDPGGVAGVTFSVAGLTIDDLRKAPWSVPVSVPDLPVGTTLQVTAVARDFSGNTGSASATITIVDRPITGVGLVTGRVFDDRSGLPLAGARVAITSGVPGGPVSFRRDIISDAAGRYQVDPPAGAVRVVVQLDGYVQTTRMVDVAAGAIASVFDARLTPRGTAVPVTSAAGGALTSGAHRLDVAAGAVVGSAALTLAHVSGQGLTAHLPAGWTPVAAAHVGPDAQAFVLPVSLSMPLDVAVPAGRTPALVQWDAVAEQWRVVADAVAVASGRIEHGVTRGGQYVVVLADALRRYQQAMGQDLSKLDETTRFGRAMTTLERSIVAVTDEHQSTINMPGVGFKGFIPAVFARLVNEHFDELMKGEAEMKITAPKELVRNRKTVPDEWETTIIETKLLSPDWPMGQPFAGSQQVHGQKAFRFLIPEYYQSSCLVCHGQPKVLKLDLVFNDGMRAY